MNKRKIISSLNKIANKLDIYKFTKEADAITKIMIKIASSEYDKIMQDMSSEDDSITSQIKARDLKTHEIIITYIIHEKEIQGQKRFLTTESQTKIIKSAAIEYVLMKHNLDTGDDFSIKLQAKNPRSNEKMWEVEYEVKLLPEDDVKLIPNPQISKENYKMQDITEKTGSDHFRQLIQEAMQQAKLKMEQKQEIVDPELQEIIEGLKKYPGDAREKAYNISMEIIRDLYRSGGFDMNDPNIENMAKEIADYFTQSNNQSAEGLKEIIDDVIYEKFPKYPEEE